MSSIVGDIPPLTSVSWKSNILIDQIGNARIADFGALTLMQDPANPSYSASHVIADGAARWMSPELFGLEDGCPATSSDCYALGMVVYETISGRVPFHELANNKVLMMVIGGCRPSRGDQFTDRVWKMLELCWAPHPKKRPSVGDVLRCLEGALNASGATILRRLQFFSRRLPSTTFLTTPRESSVPLEPGFVHNLNLHPPTTPPLVSFEVT